MIFATSDSDENSFKKYFEEMGNWLAYSFGNRKINKLNKRYKVQGIPTLIIIDSDGKVIDKNGRRTVMTFDETAIQQWM